MQKIIVEKQESLAQDKFAKNGRTKQLHIIAKNIPFSIHVASTINLNESPLHGVLYYEFEKEEDQKEVETLKCQPLTFTAKVNDKGDKASVEIRISELSSHHDGAFFRIKFSVADPNTNKMFHTFTQPIKVISKRNQVKKMLERHEVSHVEPLPTPKRTSSDVITEALLRLEEQQKEQGEILRQLVASKNSAPTENYHPIRSSHKIPDPSDMDFEEAFQRFLNSWRHVPVEERTNKMRKVMKTNTEEESQSLSEFVNFYTSENCLGVCNHKKQLEKMDNFYSDFLLEDDSVDGSSSPLQPIMEETSS